MFYLQQLKKILKVLLIIFTIFSFTVTAVVGYVFVSNYQQIGQFMQVTALVKTSFLWPTTASQLIEGATAGLVESLNDEYSIYMDSKEFEKLQSFIQPTFGGIGVYVGMKNDKITIIAPIDGSVGSKAGLKAGDVIVKLNDESTANMTLDNALKIMRGEPGTEVRISVEREGVKDPIEYKLIREILDEPTVKGTLLEENKDIAYVGVALFANNTDEEFYKEMEKLDEQGYKGLIVDLRNNPGGNLETVIKMLDYFLPEGPIVHIVDNQGRTQTFSAEGPGFKKPLVVLVDKGSASASEIFAGAIKDTKVGTLVGKNTFGKGIVQSVYYLREGAGLKLTTAKYLTPNKNDIHKVGIKPDVEVELKEIIKDGETYFEDVQLKKAIELLQGKF